MTAPADHVKAMAELIDAQAAHIKALERGHWSRETRAAVEDARDALEEARTGTQHIAGARIDPGYTTISSPGDPGHPVVGTLSGATTIRGDAQPTPAQAYLDALARLQAAAEAHPEHDAIVLHIPGQWSSGCTRCEILSPLQDAEQKAHQALIRANRGDALQASVDGMAAEGEARHREAKRRPRTAWDKRSEA